MSNFQTPPQKIRWLETAVKQLQSKLSKITNGTTIISSGTGGGNAGVLEDHDHTGTSSGGALTGSLHDSFDEFAEIAAPGTPSAARVRLYAKANGHLYQKDDAGTETDLTSGAGGGSVATDVIFDALGDLAVGTGADTAARLAAGANDTILMADSGAGTGLKWVASATPSTQAFGDAAAVGTADTFTRGDHKHAMPADPVTAHAAAADPHTGYVLESLLDAKGDLISASADNTPIKLTVGADDTILMADAAAASGLKWVASASPSAVGTAAATGTADTFTRGDHVHAHEAAHINHDTTWAALGDLIYASANDTATVLTGNITTTKKFLRQTGDGANSAAPAWDTVLAADVVATAMKQTLLLQGWQPTTTAGCGAVEKSEVGSTTKHDFLACPFDTTTAENAFLHHPMPDNYDGGTVTFRFYWFSKTGYVSTSSDGVAFTLKARAYADGDVIDSTFGTGILVSDVETANNQARQSADSSALTIGGTPAGGQMVHWVITRTVSDAADDLAADVYLIAVLVEYGISALSS